MSPRLQRDPKSKLRSHVTGGFTLLASMLFTAGVHAQPASPSDEESPSGAAAAEAPAPRSQIEEFVVTATRRATTTKDTPLAISAVTGDTLSQSNSNNIESFARLDPSVQVNNRGIGDNQIIVRGISSSGKPTVGLYYDEAVVTGLGLDGGSDNQPNIGLYDIERVEILKGPQGTLFGAGSMSGTVRFITNKPDLTRFSSRISASGAGVRDGNALYRGEAMVNAPIIEDQLGLRAVAWGDHGGGYIDQTLDNGRINEDVNDHGINGGRMMLRSRPSDRLNLLFSALLQKAESDGTQYFEHSEGPYNNISPTLEPLEDEVRMYSAVADYTLDAGALTASLSLLERDLFLARDSTPTARRFNIPALLTYHQDQELTNLSAELRFASEFQGPFQIVSGLFYAEQESLTRNAALVADDGTGTAPCAFHQDCVANGYATADINSASGRTTIDQFAVFAEASYRLTDRLGAALGLRYYEADIGERSVSTQALRFPDSPVQTEDVVQHDAEINEDEVSYNAALTYAWTDDTSLYARVASGFRPGGTNNAAAAAEYDIIVPDRYESDELWNYEAGVKSYLYRRSLYAELSLYHIDWSRQQISVTDPGGTFVYIANAGKSAVYGVEAMLNVRLGNGLSGNIGVTYTDSKLTEDLPETAEAEGRDGDRTPYSPRWAVAGQIEYEWPMRASYTGFINTHFNYRGSSYTAFNDSDEHFRKLDSYLLLGMRTGLRFDRWDLNLFVDNLTDETPEIGLRVTGDGFRVYTTRPLTVGLGATLRF